MNNRWWCYLGIQLSEILVVPFLAQSYPETGHHWFWTGSINDLRKTLAVSKNPIIGSCAPTTCSFECDQPLVTQPKYTIKWDASTWNYVCDQSLVTSAFKRINHRITTWRNPQDHLTPSYFYVLLLLLVFNFDFRPSCRWFFGKYELLVTIYEPFSHLSLL